MLKEYTEYPSTYHSELDLEKESLTVKAADLGKIQIDPWNY